MQSDDFPCFRDINFNKLPESLKYWLDIPQHVQRSPEWFAQRNTMLTASNIDAVLGRNPYNSRTEILFKKNGISAPFTGNIMTEHGCRFENQAISEYCEMYNLKCVEFGLLPHKTVDFLGGSPDGIAIKNNDPKAKPIILEVKCPYSRKIKPGKIPDHYVSQLLINMEISGFDGAFIEYVPGGHLGKEKFLNVVHLKHDPQWFIDVYPKLKEFWDEVLEYREIGIENHFEHDKWYRKSLPKKPKKTIDLFDKEKPTTENMFLDEEENLKEEEENPKEDFLD
jgi:putative phage-type endonuclease